MRQRRSAFSQSVRPTAVLRVRTRGKHACAHVQRHELSYAGMLVPRATAMPSHAQMCGAVHADAGPRQLRWRRLSVESGLVLDTAQ